MSTIIIKSGTTSIEGAIVKGGFSYFSGSTKDLGPTSVTGFYSGINAPDNGYTIYQIGGLNGVTMRVANNNEELNIILIQQGATGTTLEQNLIWASSTSSMMVNVGPIVYTVGQSALGGIIGYILQPGDPGYVSGEQHGFVVASSTQSYNATWGCVGTVVLGTGTALGTGSNNTTLILNRCGTVGIAARLCADLVSGGYSDWYLPSLDELNKLYLNKNLIGGFSNVQYWSSSEYVEYAYPGRMAWYESFDNGFQQQIGKGYDGAYTRSIRSF